MAKTVTQQRFDSLLREHVRPVLKAEGFKHSGANFRRRWKAGWHVINFQKSQWGDRDSIRFTVNIGVSVDAYSRFERRNPMKPPTEPECPWRVRIGSLLRSRLDEWWTIEDGTSFHELTKEMTLHMRRVVLPLLSRMSSLEDIEKSLRANRPASWPRWGYSKLVLATVLRDRPRELANVVAAMRKDFPDDPKWVERQVRRLRAKW